METIREPAAGATLDDLLIAYAEEARRRRKASMAYDAAYAAMPAWAQAGPRLLMGDGTLSEEFTGWPEVEALPPPSGRVVMRLIRPSISDVWRHRTMLLGPATSFHYREDGTTEQRPLSPDSRAHRRQTRLAAFTAVRKVIARVRLQREERRKVGLAELAAAEQASCARLDAIEARIRTATIGNDLRGVAADALMEARYLYVGREIEDQGEAEIWIREKLLARLAPHLTGVLRFLVDDFVHGDGSRKFWDTLIGGGLPEGADVIELAGRAHVEGIAA